MAFLDWVACPALAPNLETNAVGAGAVGMALMSAGLFWQFILVMIIVHREEGNLRLATVCRRLRLTKPRDAISGEPRGR